MTAMNNNRLGVFGKSICIALCLAMFILPGLAMKGFSAAAETADSQCLLSMEADITGDGAPELLELYAPDEGRYEIRAFLVTNAGNIELNLSRELRSECMLLMADSVRDSDRMLAASLYEAALSAEDEETPATPAETETPTPESTESVLPRPEPGYRFAFGHYEQDTLINNGPEPIIWRVLAVDDATGNVLVMSEYGLLTMKYHRKNVQISWADSDVRNWLNNTLLAGFTEEEQALIVPTTVSGSEDMIFMLDAAEIRKYLREPYVCYASMWAKEHDEKGAYVNKDMGGSSWLVRMDSTDKLINIVGGGGVLYIPAEGSKMRNTLTTADNVVRPAMWVKPEAVGEAATMYDYSKYAKAKMDISTRSGPATEYNGLGDYRVRGNWVKVLSRVFDGNIWWLQIEFDYKNDLIRCYTGLKRVDIEIERVPDESGPIGTGIVIAESDAYYGPGVYYKKQPERFLPPVGTTGTVYDRENGWVFLEWQGPEYPIRLWLPESAVAVE